MFSNTCLFFRYQVRDHEQLDGVFHRVRVSLHAVSCVRRLSRRPDPGSDRWDECTAALPCQPPQILDPGRSAPPRTPHQSLSVAGSCMKRKETSAGSYWACPVPAWQSLIIDWLLTLPCLCRVGLCDSLPETPMFYTTYDPLRPFGLYDPARACDEEDVEDGESFVNMAGSMCDNSYSFVPENDNNCQNTNFRGVKICFDGDTVCIGQLPGMESTWCRGRVTKCKAKEGGGCTDDESYSPCDDAIIASA